MRWKTAAVASTLALALATTASAQLLPGGGLPRLPALPDTVRGVVDGVRSSVDAPVRAALGVTRRMQVRELLEREPVRLDLDALGEPVLRNEFLALGLDASARDAVIAAGFEVDRATSQGDTLGLDIAVLRDTRNRAAASGLRALREAAPAVEFSHQHLYLPASTAAAPSPIGAAPVASGSIRVGLIDGGVDARAVTSMRIERHGCGGRIVPDAHGSAVARRLTSGAGGTLYTADLWCGDRVGRATLGLIDALNWMARERVPVINISLVGAHNAVLGRAIEALVDRGHVVVAAVGNDGPAAPPLYPAAYPGVIGVSGVDTRMRVLPESGSGPQVDFSAVGIVDARTRGTSFAAPVVARHAASVMAAPSPAQAREVHRFLASNARDLGAPGRDARYGDGLIAFLR